MPLLILEIAVGRHLRLDVVTAFRPVRRRFAVLGWVVTGSVLLVLSYYLVLTGWVLAFLVDAVMGVASPSRGSPARTGPSPPSS